MRFSFFLDLNVNILPNKIIVHGGKKNNETEGAKVWSERKVVALFPQTGKEVPVSEGVMCRLGGKGLQAKSGARLYG